ncbi:MAG: hypothetical protein KBT27_03480 [Prevotellaceae bacterium]|nr:hypothetical protein [Candidatus Faecinaster equi]
MSNIYYNKSYLKHHGIKGQHWGDRNGPPYPLSESKHNKVLKGSSQSDKDARENTKAEKEFDKKRGEIDRKKGLTVPTAKDKAVRISTLSARSIVAPLTILRAPLWTIHGIKTDAKHLAGLNRNDKNLKRMEKDEKDSKGLPLKKTDSTPEEDLKNVNPLYSKTKGSTNNCMACTTAYDMRRRGYDVMAGLLTQGYLTYKVGEWYPKAKRIDHDLPNLDKGIYSDKKSRRQDVRKLLSDLSKQGNGARGNFLLKWVRGGAHSMIYEVVNNSVILRDGQTSTTYSKQKDIEKILLSGYEITTYRTDNVKPDIDKMIKDGMLRWKHGQV